MKGSGKFLKNKKDFLPVLYSISQYSIISLFHVRTRISETLILDQDFSVSVLHLQAIFS